VNVVAEHAQILQARPTADGVVPSYDRRVDVAVWSDDGVLQHYSLQKAGPGSDSGSRADGDVRAEHTALLHHRGWIDEGAG